MSKDAADLRHRKQGSSDDANVAGPAKDGEKVLSGGPTTQQPAGNPGFKKLITFVLTALLFGLYKLSGSLIPPKTPPLHGTSFGTPEIKADEAKRDAVVEAFKHAWLAYERDAIGDDEYHPFSKTGSNLTEAGGIGYTVVDSIDTMLIMGLTEEYERARTWVVEKMSFERDAEFSTFETTIRVLGGLLSAYHLSGGDNIYLEKARDLGDRMLPVFDTQTGLPLSKINLAQRKGVEDRDNRGLVSTAEAATLQLEFRYLSHLTDEDVYWEKAEKVMAVMKNARLPHGLVPIFISASHGQFLSTSIRLGSRGDSYYEYLLKQYLQTDQTEDVYRDMYDDAMNGVHEHLVLKSQKAGLTYIAELNPQRTPGGEVKWQLEPKQDHLVCFFGGSLMLGATTSGALVQPVSIPPRAEELSEQGKRDWETGVELIKTCMATHETATGLSPEIAFFRIPGDLIDLEINGQPAEDWYIKQSRAGAPPLLDERYILRPETVESLFIAYRLTGDPVYRQYGWSIFEAIEKHCRVSSGGYASVLDVDQLPVEHEDKMETFLMSETLKYLYLLFADASEIPLNEYVFNTEAHPLPVFTPTIRTGFS
ncbi:glycoside hydrolase family 47 protein [Coniophora puteana RWD-64-598 SS2]|uniref:alpha-1,2-Mannosidase n=1 Tax=Coniophora puteana (strain RWD-64-598) TaxID=741705 RepID=A0A5M3N8N4_CONPW|nr:glycoside hydrolase family 47 protein [Coniophora puteana RWD-64-598 SS2]EIW87221.1 glycoside hydrolase family 47 protein [Coniophora puteana RWD-64-598 SS2]